MRWASTRQLRARCKRGGRLRRCRLRSRRGRRCRSEIPLMRIGVRKGRDHPADVEQNLPAPTLRQSLPEPAQKAAARHRRLSKRFKLRGHERGSQLGRSFNGLRPLMPAKASRAPKERLISAESFGLPTPGPPERRAGALRYAHRREIHADRAETSHACGKAPTPWRS